MHFLPMMRGKRRCEHLEAEGLATIHIIPSLSPLAMRYRKYVLTMGIDASLEIGYASESRKAQAREIALQFLIRHMYRRSDFCEAMHLSPFTGSY